MRPTDEEVGRKLRDARKRAGLTQAQLARALGKATPRISEYERGAVTVRASVFLQWMKLCKTQTPESR